MKNILHNVFFAIKNVFKFKKERSKFLTLEQYDKLLNDKFVNFNENENYLSVIEVTNDELTNKFKDVKDVIIEEFFRYVPIGIFYHSSIQTIRKEIIFNFNERLRNCPHTNKKGGTIYCVNNFKNRSWVCYL